ncbi:Hpt domain-containing protein [Methylorubrum populi]|uniref:Hpt domain-containing protein n=1 Tax=Methylorubrum populi TaxID=223967 RepID=UPI003F65C112
MNELAAAEPGFTPSAVFDADALTELEGLFGRPRLMDLLGVLDREIVLRLDPPADESAQLARDAHVLVSSSGALAFGDLSSACSALEQACLGGGDIAAQLGTAVHAARHARLAIATLRGV